MPIHTKPLLDYTKYDSADHVSWKLHRKAGKLVPPGVAATRGCMGLGLIVDTTTEDSWIEHRDTVMLPDRGIRWATIVDVPGHAFVAKGRNTLHHLATVRPTTIQFGSPRLTRHSEGPPCWDFREFPFDEDRVQSGNKTVTLKRRPTTLSPTAYPQLFRLFNAMEWAMTSTAYAVNRHWRKYREEFYKLLDTYPAGPQDRGVFLFGGGMCGEGEPAPATDIPHPATWMPTAYLAFREQDVKHLFDVITNRPVQEDDEDFKIPVGLRDGFLEALGDNLAYRAKFDGRVERVVKAMYYGVHTHEVTLVGDRGEREMIRVGQDTNKVHLTSKTFKEGDLIVEDHVLDVTCEDMGGSLENWRDMWAGDRWTLAMAGIKYDHLIPHMRMWFERQGSHILPGMVHFPSHLANAAAFRGAVDRDLMWDVKASMEYYRNDCESFVFPPILTEKWDEFAGTLPGDVPYDFAPTDLRVRFPRGE